jgi:hypothetical protein
MRRESDWRSVWIRGCQLGLADPDRVLEVMINLVDSAIEFTPPEGAIRRQACVVDADPSSVYVSASETGRGINSETKARSSNDSARIAKPSITTAPDWDWWAGACLAIFSLENATLHLLLQACESKAPSPPKLLELRGIHNSRETSRKA